MTPICTHMSFMLIYLFLQVDVRLQLPGVPVCNALEAAAPRTGWFCLQKAKTGAVQRSRESPNKPEWPLLIERAKRQMQPQALPAAQKTECDIHGGFA